MVSDDRGTPAAGGQEGGDGTPAALDGFEPYPRTGDTGRRAAIERGLRWLATRHGSRDGSVEVGDAETDAVWS